MTHQSSRKVLMVVLAFVVLGVFGYLGFGFSFWKIMSQEKTTASVLTYTNASPDMLTISSPLPGSAVEKDFTLTGEARGTWFFEASFPVQVLDKDGAVIFQAPAHADSDWMTENFVPFHIDIKIPSTYTGPAKLVLKKDNPSGMSEHDASLSFDIVVK